MNSAIYFACGSNMLTERIRLRVKSATPLGMARIDGRCLDFAKVSVDGSGKADIATCEGGIVYGVLFEIERAELDILDKYEGIDYQRSDVRVSFCGSDSDAITYIARPEKRGVVRPFSWYLSLVVAGAIQHDLPTSYQAALRKTEYSLDENADRKSRREALDVLMQAGFSDLLPGLEALGPSLDL